MKDRKENIMKNDVSSKKSFRSTFDQIESKIKKSFTTLGLIALLLFWGIVPIVVVSLMGGNYQTISSNQKVILSLINDILLIFILLLIYRKTIIADAKKFFNRDIFKHLWCSFRYWGIGLVIMVISNWIIAIFVDGTLAVNEQEVRKLIDSYPLYMAFQLIIYAPLTEELIFRKSIKDIQLPSSFYVFLSGFIFGGMHVVSSLESAIDLLYLIPYCSLGFVFAYLYQKTDNIFSTITAHAFHNALALMTYLLMVIK